MLDIFLKTLPFFALIGLGFGASRMGAFPPEATKWLTKFVFYFALSAMLIRLGANIAITELFDPAFAAAYLTGSLTLYAICLSIARARGAPWDEAAVEAQCSVIGNTGFLGIPMLVAILGPQAAAPILLTLLIDMVVFSALITLMISANRATSSLRATLVGLGKELLQNPILMSGLFGVLWGASGVPVPVPINEFLGILGAAATPAALFSIGASLAERKLERPAIAAWLSFAKLGLHPLFIAITALWLFPVEAFAAKVLIITSALPVAGNTYILAVHYGVAPQRVSASILISTVCSILTLTAVIAWVTHS